MSLNVGQVINRALILHGVLAPGGTPNAAEAADVLTEFNALKRAWFGTLIGPRLSAIPLTGTNAQAENGGEYQIPGAVAFTLTAPGNPRSGDRFGVVDAGLAWSGYPLTINGNGQLLNGSAVNTVINTAGANARYWFRGDTGNWVQEADWGSLTSAIEFPDPIIAYMPYMLAVAIAAVYGQDVRAEVAYAAGEGRTVMARTYGRRGRANVEGPIGLTAAPQPGQGG